MKSYRRRTRTVLACALSSFVLLACAAAEEAREDNAFTFDPEELYAAEIATIGMDRITRAPVVLVRTIESGRIVPIWVGLYEAQAIARGLHGIEPSRPLTHDLMASLLRAGDSEIEKIVVHDIRDGTYFGAVHLVREGGVMRIDSRPSDAMALALRLGVPIEVAGKVIEDARDFQFIPPDETEQVVRLFGMTLVFPTDEHRETFGLGDRAGALVTEAAGAARDKGIRRGDLIVRVGEESVETPAELLDLAGNRPAGAEVEITYRREEEEHTVTFTVPSETEAPVGI